MALKPDVTLSIIKNSGDVTDRVQKVYYDESVYRVSKGTRCFKEISQVGLECIGGIDDYCIYEVLTLAAGSLATLSEDFVLDVSHLGIVSAVLDRMALQVDDRRAVIKCIGERNLHEMASICERSGAQGGDIELLRRLISTYGTAEEVMPKLRELSDCLDEASLAQLSRIMTAVASSEYADRIHIDFSVVSDINYYNGITFKGFIAGVPTSVLTGGQYDRLMQKMHRRAKAIGFAVYMDMVEQHFGGAKEYDVDVVLLYDDSADIAALDGAVRDITASGRSVMVQKSVPEKIKCREIMNFCKGGVTADE
ncbi:MAG: ATP phosphoribosyltransferase regulatory subunit [Clostridia bacterium]|nr:ATP phosphoribosyltransferase regulatory subunit [Clostridia bacterium]